MKSFLRRLSVRYSVLVALVPLLVLWDLVGRADVTIAIPPLQEIWEGLRAAASRPDFFGIVLQSLQSLGIGYGLALVIGTLLGAGMGLVRALEDMLGIYVNMMMGAPIAAFIPLIIAIFGLGQAATILTVFIFSVFFITVNAMTGVRSAPTSLREMAHSFNASRGTILRKVILPNALPLWLSGVRTGLSRGFAGLILGEILIVVVGLGGLIMNAASAFRMGELWAIIAVVTLLSVVSDRILAKTQRRVSSWSLSVNEA